MLAWLRSLRFLELQGNRQRKVETHEMDGNVGNVISCNVGNTIFQMVDVAKTKDWYP